MGNEGVGREVEPVVGCREGCEEGLRADALGTRQDLQEEVEHCLETASQEGLHHGFSLLVEDALVEDQRHVLQDHYRGIAGLRALRPKGGDLRDGLGPEGVARLEGDERDGFAEGIADKPLVGCLQDLEEVVAQGDDWVVLLPC